MQFAVLWNRLRRLNSRRDFGLLLRISDCGVLVCWDFLRLLGLQQTFLTAQHEALSSRAPHETTREAKSLFYLCYSDSQ
jgi:hypothetical protein